MSKFKLLILFMSSVLMPSMVTGEALNKLFEKEGYVITNEGEKVNGILSLRRDRAYDEVKIKFTDSEGNKFTYKADMIKEFAFRDIQDDEAGNRVWKWNYFVSKKVDTPPIPFGPKDVFMERVVEGNVNLYQYWIQVNKDVENPYKREFYLERGTEWVKLTEESYIEEAKKFFSDNEALAIQMGQVNHRFRHMENVTKQYNTWLNKQVNF